MPIPKSKNELFDQSRLNYQKLNELVESFSEYEKLSEFPPGTMNRNIRDVLAHLHHWHLMFINWYTIGMKGEKPEMPAKGYSWKDTKALNKKIWKDYQKYDLIKIRDSLDKSHLELQTIINKHGNKELFEKKRYKWTGSSSLATYLRSNTSSHYRWANNLIRKAKK